MKHVFFLLLFCSYEAISTASNNYIKGDSIKPPQNIYKNKIALELIGNPLNLSFEHEFYRKNKLALNVHVGLNLPCFLVYDIPGCSLGLNTQLNVKNIGLFCLNKNGFPVSYFSKLFFTSL